MALLGHRHYIDSLPFGTCRRVGTGLVCSDGVAFRAVVWYEPRLALERWAMKSEIHPDYHEITVIMTDGSSYTTRSTYGKAGDTLRLDVDPKSHPAWTGGSARMNEQAGQLARFNKRFQGFGIKY
jgi:large subunit ribosomal protein L31